LSGVNPTGSIRPFITTHEVGSIGRLITNQESLTATVDATVTGKTIELLGGANGSADTRTVYFAVFSGASAVKTPAQWKSIMQTMGYAVGF
jgi:hypothetical protein